MTIYTQTPTGGPGRLSEHTAPLGDVLGADILQSWLYAPTSSILRSGELRVAEQGAPSTFGAAIGAALGAPYLAAGAPGLPAFLRNEPDSPIVDAETARSRMAEAEVEFEIPEAGIRERALGIMIDRHKREAQIQSTQARAPGGWGVGAARLGVSLGTQMADPLNVASAFIPVFGPARYTAALGRAGGAVGRAGVRARFGAVEGAVGAAAVEPIIYGAATQEQADYGLADSLLNIGLGTVLGGGLHVGAGVAVDAVKRGKSWKTQRAAEVNPTAPLPRVLDAMSHQEREQLLRTSTAQALTGREINPLVTYERGGLRLDDPVRAAIDDGVQSGIAVPRAEIGAVREGLPPQNVSGFTTAKGSTYEVLADGTTIRNKAARPDVGHEDDSGVKAKTLKTVYVESDASVLSAAGLHGLGSKGARVAIKDGKATLVTWNDKADKWGASADSRDIPVFDEPAVGRHPLELWKRTDDVPGFEAYANMHAGNAITEVRGPAPPAPRRPEDIRTAVNASFAPEASRLYDADGVRAADEKIKSAPADDVFPEQSLGEAMEDVTALVASLDELTGGNLADMVSREMEPFDEVQMTAEAYGRAVQEAASCGLRRGTA